MTPGFFPSRIITHGLLFGEKHFQAGFMGKLNVHYWTGVAGIGMCAFGMMEVPLYFIYNEPPPAWNIIIQMFINMLTCIGLIGFISGFRNMIIRFNPAYEGLGSFIFSIGVAYAILTYVADSIQVGAAWLSTTPIGFMLEGARTEELLLIYGPIERLLTTVLLVACGLAIIMTRFIPIWMGLLACIVSVVHVVLAPTIFHRSESTDFFRANGWNIPVAGGFFLIWVLVVSIFLLRNKRRIEIASHNKQLPSSAAIICLIFTMNH